MVWVRTNQTLIVQVLCSVLCSFLLPPFALPHDRIRALTFVKMQGIPVRVIMDNSYSLLCRRHMNTLKDIHHSRVWPMS